MTRGEKESLLCCLEAICEIDRQAECSAIFFRQVYTAKITALRASGLIERLREDIEKEEQ